MLALVGCAVLHSYGPYSYGPYSHGIVLKSVAFAVSHSYGVGWYGPYSSGPAGVLCADMGGVRDVHHDEPLGQRRVLQGRARARGRERGVAAHGTLVIAY